MCIRHGKTEYTGKFPDLTDQGKADAKRIALVEVQYWMRKKHIAPNALRISSSPSARAHGTAEIIAEAIRHPNGIFLEKEIDQMAWRNEAAARNALKGFAGRGYIDYETEPVFADPTVFETPNEMRTRWYNFLTSYIQKSEKREFTQYGLVISHYEVFCHLTRELFGITASASTALKHVEPIELSITRIENELYSVVGNFRTIESMKAFSTTLQSFVRI